MQKIAVIYTPCASKDEAEKIAEELIASKLIACANIYQSESIYKWKGNLQKEKETILIAKTLQEMLDRAMEKIKELHSYDVPAILSWKAESHTAEYTSWVKEQLM